ncbi:MAG: cysteine synthase family protein [candidate division Zixibacteria bacterium]|nr:cysteine synthase family protein [candidate division Zixibacteria bacterium]
MVRLRRLSDRLGHNIQAKLEFLNPSGSVKDRMALYIIEAAERSGWIKPGDLLIDNSSGNTAISVAMVATVKGYRSLFTVPDKTSQEKIDLIKALGAEVVVCPTDVPHDDPRSYYESARRLARERGGYLIDQYHNPLNIESHFATTGPEIWEQTDGKIDVFVAGIGTGGTLSGVARFLKSKKPDIRVIAIDPVGSVFHNLFKFNELQDPGRYLVEGLGSDTPCGALDMTVIEEIVQVDDRESFASARQLVIEEGMITGGSSGSAIAGIERWLKREAGNPALNIVTVLPDSGMRYVSKFLSNDWMAKIGL